MGKAGLLKAKNNRVLKTPDESGVFSLDGFELFSNLLEYLVRDFRVLLEELPRGIVASAERELLASFRGVGVGCA